MHERADAALDRRVGADHATNGLAQRLGASMTTRTPCST
jgi:hypothetical protein